MMGWDEILHPDLPKDTVIHSWRGQESLGAAAKQGYRGVLSNGYYIDQVWSADRHYATDPWDKGVDQLPEAERARILGGEATMWSEFTSATRRSTRASGRARRRSPSGFWSPREVKDVDDMYARLDADEPLAGVAGPRPPRRLRADARSGSPGRRYHELRMLADVVEPLENYQRGETGHYTQQTPLNRLWTRCGRRATRRARFSRQVEALLADPARQTGREAIRARLAEWAGLSTCGCARCSRAATILREAVPLAAEASALAAAGLEALGFLEEGGPAPESWWSCGPRSSSGRRSPATALEVAYRPALRRLHGGRRRAIAVRPGRAPPAKAASARTRSPAQR